MPPLPKAEARVENAVAELAAAFFALAQIDATSAFRKAGGAVTIISEFRSDLLRSEKVKLEDL